jgi:tubby-related protein 1
VEIIHNPPSSESSPSGKWPFPPKFNLDNFPTTSAMMRNFLTSPLPPGQTLQCFIKRSKSGLARLYPVYHMYTTEGARYMLTAKKVVMNSTSNYILCMQRDNLSTKSENYLGKVKSNFMGTEFMLYDNGMNPKHTKNTMVIRN